MLENSTPWYHTFNMQRTSAEILHNFYENISQLKNLSHLNVFINETLADAEEKVNEAAKRTRKGDLTNESV